MTFRQFNNIAEYLSEMARLEPQDVAVAIQRIGTLTDSVRYDAITFADLNRESDLLACGLADSGVGRGTRVVLMVKPGLDFFALTFALFRLGAVPVLIDPGMGLRNLKSCMAQARPEVFIGTPKAHLARVLLGWARETLRLRVMVGYPAIPFSNSLACIRQAGREIMHGGDGVGEGRGRNLAPGSPDDTAAILFTSGSTGAPKGVLYTHRIFLDQVECLRELYGIEPGERDVATFPLFALFGPALGMTAVVPAMDATRPAHVRPERIVAAVRDWKATNLFGSPALLNRVGRWGEAHRKKLSTLRRAISAGAPADPSILERFGKMLKPGVQVFTPYGATESLPVCSIGSRDLLGEAAERSARGAGVCVGRPAPRVEVAVIRIEEGAIGEWREDLRLPQGEIGEIAVKGPRVTREYFGLPEATALAKIPDSAGGAGAFWHRMGDVGYFDNEGLLWFCGRKAHRVVTPAGTLFTVPCERIFNAHSHVLRTALVGVGESGAMRPVLCVELERPGGWSEVALERLRQELLGMGRAHEQTRSIETILFHPSFPVDIRHNAKISREKLAQWAKERV